jgi:hypothetical protein
MSSQQLNEIEDFSQVRSGWIRSYSLWDVNERKQWWIYDEFEEIWRNWTMFCTFLQREAEVEKEVQEQKQEQRQKNKQEWQRKEEDRRDSWRVSHRAWSCWARRRFKNTSEQVIMRQSEKIYRDSSSPRSGNRMAWGNDHEIWIRRNIQEMNKPDQGLKVQEAYWVSKSIAMQRFIDKKQSP